MILTRFSFVVLSLLALPAFCGGCEANTKEAVAPIQTRKTIGKTTQNVLELNEALAAGGVLAESTAEGNGLEVYADAYRSSVAKIAGIAVTQKMQLYKAEHESVPATHADFMDHIIEPGKPNGLALPMLPYYQEYSFDPQTKSLVVVEFPAKKEQRQKETTGSSGL